MTTGGRVLTLARPPGAGPVSESVLYWSNRKRNAVNVAVLSFGAAGWGLAAYLAAQGVSVLLHDPSESRLAPFRAQGGICVKNPDDEDALIRPSLLTTELAEAVTGADIVFAVAPPLAHHELALRLNPYLRPGHVLLLLPGGTGGALEVGRVLRNRGTDAVLVGEAEAFPFVVRMAEPGTVVLQGVKRVVRGAALPAWRTPELLSVCRPLLPMLSPATSVLETSFGNVGAVLSSVLALVTAGGSPGGESVSLTREVVALLEAADAERRAVAKVYGVEVPGVLEWLNGAYGGDHADLASAIQHNPAFSGLSAFEEADFVVGEHVSAGLVPIVDLGLLAEVPCPVLIALVHVVSAMYRTDFWAQGRTLERMGLSGLSPSNIRALVAGEWGSGPGPTAECFDPSGEIDPEPSR